MESGEKTGGGTYSESGAREGDWGRDVFGVGGGEETGRGTYSESEEGRRLGEGRTRSRG